jgi:hypothetical protein
MSWEFETSMNAGRIAVVLRFNGILRHLAARTGWVHVACETPKVSSAKKPAMAAFQNYRDL